MNGFLFTRHDCLIDYTTLKVIDRKPNGSFGPKMNSFICNRLRYFLVLSLCMISAAQMVAQEVKLVQKQQLSNEAYTLEISIDKGIVKARLDDKSMKATIADGAVIYGAVKQGNTTPIKEEHLKNPSIILDADTLVVRGKLAGLLIEHRFTLSARRKVMEEKVIVTNNTGKRIVLTDFEIGLIRRVTDQTNNILTSFAEDRIVAVPFRYRTPDSKGTYYDYSVEDLVNKPGQVIRMNNNMGVEHSASRHRCSEAWAWSHGKHTLGIFSFNQENMVFSVISKLASDSGTFLRIGGAVMIGTEPAALTRLAPGDRVDMGLIRYVTLEGNYTDAMYAYREMLDEKGSRFPRSYDPPVHWEQLYDMSGAWDNRAKEYTRSILDTQAMKAKEYSCEALYLDPGWDTDFGTFLWGEQWLGPRKKFIEEMRSEYGLRVSLHAPLATWMSHQWSWGIGAVKSYPKTSWRKLPVGVVGDGALPVPVLHNHRRNLSLLSAAKANASSVVSSSIDHPFFKISNLNNGWAGNTAAWVAQSDPAWAEIDLGKVYHISRVVLGNDQTCAMKDRSVMEFDLLVATEYDMDSKSEKWKKVKEYRGEGIHTAEKFDFEPVAARWVRVDILKTANQNPPRIDEMEIYEATPFPEKEAKLFEKNVRLSIQKAGLPPLNPIVCLGSKQYLDVAEKRLMENCADGVTFLMFDGNWWNGGCADPGHGHPVPYTMEDHIRANLELAKRIHARYPDVLIEMHDMVAGGAHVRSTPIYYKYGLEGSFDEIWGFELMWSILADVREGRAMMLYYANLGSNIPIYLHINLAQDNEHLLGLWWYASTCRHLGIGGTHSNARIADAQKRAMKYYRGFDRFYKRGEFYGISEEIHLHVLPEENAFMVNVFNLSDKPRRISGRLELQKAGLKANNYLSAKSWADVENGILKIGLEMPAWSAQVVDIHAVH